MLQRKVRLDTKQDIDVGKSRIRIEQVDLVAACRQGNG